MSRLPLDAALGTVVLDIGLTGARHLTFAMIYRRQTRATGMVAVAKRREGRSRRQTRERDLVGTVVRGLQISSRRRVLSAGGDFLYADVLSVEDWAYDRASLMRLGFAVEREFDITSNVLLSCDDVAKSRAHAFHIGNDPHLMQNFLAMPGSEVYVQMSRRRWKYNLLKLCKKGLAPHSLQL
jgi:hypothetical protein